MFARPTVQRFLKNWYTPEILPIVGIMGFAVGGASWYLYRLAWGPEVAWDKKNNPYPWLDIKPNENAKMLAVSKEFDGKWARDKF
ncbi:hypothetical protein IWQ61_004473 [Dispira simplex]|nr:hypothetical protein IWQ61_004473 [Dispira simplex]